MTTDENTVEIDNGVLVGHDGSGYSVSAMRWAMRFAACVGMQVTFVRAWSLTTAPRPITWSRGYMPPMADFEQATREQLESEVADLRRKYTDIAVSYQAVHGKPAPILLEASRRADLMVLGPRGRGAVRGMVLGSVSDQCVRHAECPVVVTHGREDETLPPPSLPIDDEVDASSKRS